MKKRIEIIQGDIDNMYKIIYMGAYNEAICDILINFKKVKIDSYIIDSSISDIDKAKMKKFWEQNGICEVQLTEDNIRKVDAVFVCGYTKIIKSELINKYTFVNIHAGNLPKWRGTSANSWAIVNGDYNIAYTIHRVTDELDGGPIFYKYEYLLKKGEMYGDGRKQLEELLKSNLEEVFIDICSKKNQGIMQEGKYVYCNSFRKEDGYINNWNKNSSEIIGLYKIFGQPYGSGIYINYKGKTYELMDIESDDTFEEAIGIAGAIVNKNKENVWIKTKDTAVKISKIKDEDENVIEASEIFSIGARL